MRIDEGAGASMMGLGPRMMGLGLDDGAGASMMGLGPR